MAQSDSAASSYTVVLLEKNVPPISKNTDEQTRQKVLIPLGYNEGRLTNIMSASCVAIGGGKEVKSGAVYKLYGKKDVTELKSVTLLYHMTMYNSENIEISSTSEIVNAFTEAKNKYECCLKFIETGDRKVIISGPSATVEAFCDYLNEQSAELLLSASTNPPIPDETIDDSVHVATAMPLTTVPQKVYDNMSPDALALLEKLPIGQIEGVYYNPKAGKVTINNETTEKEDERITKFQTAYQSILSRKVKTIEVPIPATVSPDALANLVHQYNQTYDQCVFSVQEGEFPCVKIVSTSSRQHDQARTLLTEELVKMVTPTLPAVSKCEVIHLSKTRTLTLKKANIVEEEVDIIVNPANERLAHGGGVAAALDKASNWQLQKFSNRYIEKKGTVPVGCIAITVGGGALKCDKVIHAVGPDTRYGEAECERLLIKVINEALKGAERHNASSIAFPAISTGIFGVRKELVARCLVDTVMTYHLTKPHPVLSDIRIVIIDEKTYAPFARYFQQKMASLKIGSNRHRPLIQPAKLKAPTSTPISPPPVADATDKGTQLVAPEPAAPPDMTLGLLKDSSTIVSLLEGLADNWHALGSLLGLSKPDLDQINSVPAAPKVYLDRIVTKWLMRDATSSPTISALVNTLAGIKGTEQIVQSILEEYGEQNAKQFKHQTSQEEAQDVSAIQYPVPNDMPDTTAETSNVSLADSSGTGPTDSLTTTTASTTPNTGVPASPLTDNTTDQLPSSTSAPSMFANTNTNTNVNGMATPTTHPLQPPLSTPPGFTSQVSIPTPGGYNHGQNWGYPTTQGGNAQFPVAGSFTTTTTASTTGVMATGIQQNPTPHPNQPSPRGVTPQLLAQRSPLPGDGMNPQHGEVGPRPAGVGTFNAGHGTTGKNYSQAVVGSGSRQDIGSAVTAQPSSTHQTGQDNSVTKNSKGTTQTKEDSAECPICLSGFKDPVNTKCGHFFCRGCINEALQHSPYCPSCKTALRKIVGNQPNGGKMTVKYSRNQLPGYPSCGTIEIHYEIYNGTQSKLHPHPGRKFQGAYRIAYLPDNPEGREVLQLLKRAFDARLTFTVGTSITSGQNDVVTWNDIHHKTYTHGGPYGYPDSTYLARVRADLAAKGIVTVDNTAV